MEKGGSECHIIYFYALIIIFGHTKPYDTFLREDGSFLRQDLASNVDEGDEEMIRRHNSVVKDEDRVYFLGDVCFHKKHLHKVGRMKGRKVLIKGNHDLLKVKDYMEYFDDIRGIHQFKGLVMTHVPIHADSLGRWGFNVHGHLHANRVADDRYFNASMECINYTPISLEEVKKHAPKTGTI